MTDCTNAALGTSANQARASVGFTDALLTCGRDPCNVVHVEVIGGRKNILGPLHVPWKPWTGPGEFDPNHPEWTDEYLLTDHGLIDPPVFELLE